MAEHGHSFDEMMYLIEKYPAAAKQLVMAAESEGRLVDATGLLNRNRQLVYGHIKMGRSELVAGTAGDRYRIDIGRTSDKTYNTDRLLRKINVEGEPMAATIQMLVGAGVIKLAWQWQKLEAFMRMNGLELDVSKQPVHDGDDKDVGVVWKDATPTYSNIQEEAPDGR